MIVDNPLAIRQIHSSADNGADAGSLLDVITRLDVGEVLSTQGALLLRAYRIDEEALRDVIKALLPKQLNYVHGNTPRTQVAEKLYTSTEYPCEYTISMHSELSYACDWPDRLLFYCVQPARSGGATMLVDNARWFEALDPEIQQAFAGGLRYQQFLHGGNGFGRSWRQTFETADRTEVERLLRAAGVEWEWTGDDALRTVQVRPSTIRHPVSGVELWFNQVDQWHPAGLGEGAARGLAAILPPEEMPQSVSFADGSPIPHEYVRAVRDSGLELAVDVEWERGDILVIDNRALAHGRRPFTGERRVLVAMSG